jgi:hypothetical protein
MGIVAIIVIGVAVLALVYLVMIYNNLVQVKHNVSKAWANIDVLLKQRHDELPKLIDVVRSYAGYERELLQKVTLNVGVVRGGVKVNMLPAACEIEADARFCRRIGHPSSEHEDRHDHLHDDARVQDHREDGEVVADDQRDASIFLRRASGISTGFRVSAFTLASALGFVALLGDFGLRGALQPVGETLVVASDGAVRGLHFIVIGTGHWVKTVNL